MVKGWAKTRSSKQEQEEGKRRDGPQGEGTKEFNESVRETRAVGRCEQKKQKLAPEPAWRTAKRATTEIVPSTRPTVPCPGR